MSEPITFTDGDGYERYMGVWSRSVGDVFLDWLAPAPNLRWLDVGCGNGAFTETIVTRCAPSTVEGVDPAEAQIAFAQKRPTTRSARFRIGDAMALPFPDDSFDVAVMPLVIFFVPDPLTGVREMARVVRPGGAVTAYGWDLLGGGFPYSFLQEEMEAVGIPPRWPPNPDAANLERLRSVWTAAGLTEVETREIPVQRTFAGLDDLWETAHKGPNLGPLLAGLSPEKMATLKSGVARRFAAGPVTLHGRANAVRGRAPSR